MIFQSFTKSHENKSTRYRISRRIDWRPPQMPKIGQKSIFRKIPKKSKYLILNGKYRYDGGDEGIRTLERVSPLLP